MPKISIIMPVYNRENLVSRAIDSCLNQDYKDFEVVVVDDCSTDNSCTVINGYLDKRVRLVKHAENKGSGIAYQTGVSNSIGEWFLFLDSDDELVPGVLKIVNRLTVNVSNDIGRIGFMYKYATGGSSPEPEINNEILDKSKYIKWLATDKKRSDILYCFRKECFESIEWPKSSGLESLLHLDFTDKYKTQLHNIFGAIVHLDANNRLTMLDSARLLKFAPEYAQSCKLILQRHGESIKNTSKKLFLKYLRWYGIYEMLSFNRKIGFKMMLKCIISNPFDLLNWILLIVGGISPRILARLIPIGKYILKRVG